MPVTIAAASSPTANGTPIRAVPAAISRPDRSAGEMSLAMVIVRSRLRPVSRRCVTWVTEGYSPPMPKRRLDTLLAERGLFETRTRAAAAVMAGAVRVTMASISRAESELVTWSSRER